MTLSIYMFYYRMKTKLATEYAKLSEKGQGMVEYAMILAAVAVVAVVVLWNSSESNSLIGSIKKAFEGASNNISTATGKATAAMGS